MMLLMSVIHRQWFRLDPLVPRPMPSMARDGLLVAVDWETKAIRWQRDWDSPAGTAFVDDELWIASMGGHRVTRLGRDLNELGALRHPLFNDLHTLSRTEHGILIAASGVDGLMEVRCDGTPLWQWLGGAHGYHALPSGRARLVDARLDYSTAPRATEEQTTHINSAYELNPSVILATLFIQGELVAIQRSDGRARTLVRGMDRPHAIRPWPGHGWTVCDSGIGAVVRLDTDFGIVGLVEGPFNWVQDAMPVADARMVIADANHSRVVEWDTGRDCLVDEWRYPAAWKVFGLQLIPPLWEAPFTMGGDGGGEVG